MVDESTTEWRLDKLEENVRAFGPVVGQVNRLEANFDSLQGRVQRHGDEMTQVRGEAVATNVLAERMDNVLDGMRAARNALYTAGGGFFILAVSVLYKVLSG